MLFKRATIYFLILACCLLAIGTVFWPGAGGQQIKEQEFEKNEVGPAGLSSQAEKQEYKQDMALLSRDPLMILRSMKSLRMKSRTSGATEIKNIMPV